MALFLLITRPMSATEWRGPSDEMSASPPRMTGHLPIKVTKGLTLRSGLRALLRIGIESYSGATRGRGAGT